MKDKQKQLSEILTSPGKHFDWFIALQLCVDITKEGKELEYRCRYKLEDMAGHWPSCACGQLCRALPRRGERAVYHGAPRDGVLMRLGIEFTDCVEDQNWEQAIITFEKIEARSKHLLIKMGKLKPMETTRNPNVTHA